MKARGLCITCTEDSKCSFMRRFPVIYCEEFTDFISERIDKTRKRRR